MTIKYTRLSDTLYRVQVPILSTYTEFDIETMGIPLQESVTGKTTGIEEEMTLVMLPLTRIIDIYSTGAPIRLVDQDELVRIYKELEDYLRETNSVATVLNASGYEDSRDTDIDRFASEIFNLNRVTIVNETINKRSGFDIGIHKLQIPNKYTRKNAAANTINITDAYSTENPTAIPADIYITHNNNNVDPAKVKRKPMVRKRRKLSKGDTNA